MTPDGRRAVSVADRSSGCGLWDLGRGRCTTSMPVGYVYHMAGFCAMPDGEHVMFNGSGSGVMRAAVAGREWRLAVAAVASRGREGVEAGSSSSSRQGEGGRVAGSSSSSRQWEGGSRGWQ